MKINDVFNKVKCHKPSILGSEQYKKFSVLIPLMEHNGKLTILFEVRSEQMRRQPGDISFPGGKIDKDDRNPKEAAVREAVEELGVKKEQISNVHPLDYLVSPFGMIVYPYVGYMDPDSTFNPNPKEVGETFLVPLSFFEKTEPSIHHVNVEIKPNENFPVELIVGGESYQWRTNMLEEYFYQFEDRVIWGLTARILAHFIELIKK